MNEESLHEKIVADLKKSGFASELECFEILSHKQWNTNGGTAFYDRDSGITRNIDLQTRLIQRNDKVGVELEILLPIEVKKSEKPWIVLGRDDLVGDLIENPIVAHDFPCKWNDIRLLFNKMTIRRKMKWLGHGVHEFLKKPEARLRWFESAAKLCKFTVDYVDQTQFQGTNLADTFKNRSFFSMIQPVVLLDGKLFKAISKSGLSVEEVGYAALDFTFGTPQYNQRNYRVDLVTLAALEEYLDIQKALGENIFTEMYDGKRVRDNITI